MKKLILYLITISLMLPIFSTSFAAGQEESTAAADENAYDKLVAFGVLEEGDLSASGEVTRGEFITAVMRMCNTMIGSSGEIPFADVAVGSDLYSAVSMAYQLGFVSGDQYFRPDDAITRMEAIKLLLCAVGYGQLAQWQGGYPVGYLAVAGQLDLLDGSDTSAAMRRAQAATLILDALECDLLIVSGVGDTITYETDPDETLLSQRYGIYQTEGVFEADAYTDLMAQDSGLKEGRILLDGVEYILEENSPLLGYYCEAYYIEDTDNKTILFLEEEKNETLSFQPRDIDSVEGRTVYYSADAKSKKARLSTTASLILNGKLTEYQPEKLQPEEGNITLIDNNQDGIFEVAKVTSYEIMQVSGISVDNNTIYTVSGESLELDPDSREYDFAIEKNGKAATLADLQVDDAILYAASSGSGRNYRTVLASNKTVVGKILEKDEDGVKIENKYYETNDTLNQVLIGGKYGTFYLDPFGKIILADMEPTIVYGYLNDMEIEKMGDVKVKIFTENDRWVTLSLNNTLTYNQTSGVSAAQAGDTLMNVDGGPGQLITYRVNSEAKIVELNTSRYFVRGSDEEAAAREANVFRRYSDGEISLQYRQNSKTFSSVLGLSDSDTVIFSIPTEENRSDEDAFSIVTTSTLLADRTYSLNAYDVDELGIPAVVVLRGDDVSVINDQNTIQNMFIVKGFSQALNMERQTKSALVGYRNGQKMTITLKDETVLMLEDGEVKVGDIIQYATDRTGDVVQIVRINQAENSQGFLQGGIWSTCTFVGGTVKAVDASSMRINIQYTEKDEGVFSLSNTVYIYDSDKNLVRAGTAQDILKDDYVVASMRYQCVRELIIIR